MLQMADGPVTPSDATPAKKPGWKDRLKNVYNAAAQKGKAVYDDLAKNTGNTVETLNVLVSEKDENGEAKKLSFKERLNVVVGHVGKTEWLKVAKETAKDLTTADELKRLAGTVIALPGGIAVYGAYRVAKHRKEKLEEAANVNKPTDQSKPAAPAAPKP